MGKHLEDIGIAEHLAVIGQPHPRLLRAVAVPVGEAVIDQLNSRVVCECSQQYQRNKQEGHYDNSLLFVIG
ncbi:hypothetical protein D3C73_875950 [compost metagenome]